MLPLAMSAEAVIGIALGVPTLAVTVYFGVKQIRVSRFKVEAKAFLAELGDSIWVTVANVGSVEGTIHSLEITDAQGTRIELPGAGKNFEPFKLTAQSSRQIDFNAPEDRDFKTDDKVVVRWGKHAERLEPLPSAGSVWDKNKTTESAKWSEAEQHD
jgi:hypothetical protein